VPFVVLLLTAVVATPASALTSPERHYEMVSPVYKGGYGATGIEAVAPTGEAVAFFSPGAFAGAPQGPLFIGYVARRGATGWSTVPVMPPASILPYVATEDVSSTLDSVVVFGKPGPNIEAATQVGPEEEFLEHIVSAPDTQSNWMLAGSPFRSLEGSLNGEALLASYKGGSADLCYLLVTNSRQPLTVEAEEAVKTQEVYVLDRGCNGGQPSLHLLGLNNAGKVISPFCSTDAGLELYDLGRSSEFNAVAAGGRAIFFTTNVEKKDVCGNTATGIHQLFVRLGGSRTVEVSRPLLPACEEVPCAGAKERMSSDFIGASEDGSRVFFATSQPLVAEDTDTASDLYMASFGCSAGEVKCDVTKREVKSLVAVSHDSNLGEAGEFQGVVRIAPDGSRVYFVARGVLSEGPNAEGRSPVVGADNLYVYDAASKRTVFVAALCSGAGLSGTVSDIRCGGKGSDVSLWSNSGDAQTAGSDGRFLVFSSYGRLTGDDTDTAQDVYRYDAESGLLVRVSAGEDGYEANGNSDGEKEVSGNSSITPGNWGGEVRLQYEMGTRAVSEDGSRVVFESAVPLSPDAVNGLANVYEWHEGPAGEGSVSLISSGSGTQPVEKAVISPGGNDVFFITSQSLVSQDVDEAPDIYDARIGAGFPQAPAPAQACSGDACQGPLTNPAPLLVPGSVSQAPGGNFAAPTLTNAAVTPKAKACRKGYVKKKGKCVRHARKKNSQSKKKRK
jgi:hypothetical protein